MLKQYGEKKKGIKQQTWYSQGKYRVWNVTRKKENIDKDMLVWRNIYKNKHINEKKDIWLYTCLRKKGHITSYTQEIWKEYYDKLRTQWT